MPVMGYVRKSYAKMFDKNFEYDIDKFYTDFIEYTKEIPVNIELNATQRIVKATTSAIDKSLKKCDHEYKPIIIDSDLEYSDSLYEDYMKPFLTTPLLINNGEFSLDLTKLSGAPYIYHGLTSKGQAINSDLFIKLENVEHIPLYTISPKKELLPMQELLENKIRTTFCPSVNLLLKQKLFFDNQNKQILKQANSPMSILAYGFTKQYGGYSRMYKEFEKFGYLVKLDISGFDRCIDLRKVYGLRMKYLKCPSQFYGDLYQTYIHTVSSYCIAPNGLLFYKKDGNCSGGNSTAADNSIAHLRVVVHFFVKLFSQYKGRLPTWEDFLKHSHHKIYSDDIISGYTRKIVESLGLEKFEQLMRDTYLWHHLVIKNSAFSIYNHEEGTPIVCDLEFLGSLPRWNGSIYVPYPRVTKLASSLKFTSKQLDIEEQVNKVLAIAYQGLADPPLYDECISYLEYLQSRPDYIHVHKDTKLTIKEVIKGPGYFHYLLTGRERGYIPQSGVCFNFLKHPCASKYSGRFKKNLMATSRVDKAYRLMNSFVNKGLLTKEGEMWDIQAFDPFNDDGFDPVGAPDGQNIHTCPLVIKKTFEVRKPSGLPVGNWTLHAFTLPITQPVPFTPINIVTPGVGIFDALPVGQAGAGSFTLDTLNFHGVLDGAQIGILNMSSATKIGSLGITGTIGSMTEKYRVVSMGWEAINTTPALVTQGMGHFYTCTSKTEQETNVFTAIAGGYLNGSSTSAEMEFIPANPSQALALAGSLQWPAKEGCYTVVPFDSNPIPNLSSSARKGIYFVDRTNIVTPTYWAEDVQQIPYALPQLVWSFGPNDITNQQQTGAIFTGLPETATITFNLKIYVELITGAFLPSEQNYSRLARKCAGYDAAAFQFYNAVVGHMPVSVPQKYNGLGDWFLGAANKALNFINPVLKMIPHPVAQGVHQVTSVAQGVTNGWVKERNERNIGRAAKQGTITMGKAPTVRQITGPISVDSPSSSGKIPYEIRFNNTEKGGKRNAAAMVRNKQTRNQAGAVVKHYKKTSKR